MSVMKGGDSHESQGISKLSEVKKRSYNILKEENSSKSYDSLLFPNTSSNELASYLGALERKVLPQNRETNRPEDLSKKESPARKKLGYMVEGMMGDYIVQQNLIQYIGLEGSRIEFDKIKPENLHVLKNGDTYHITYDVSKTKDRLGVNTEEITDESKLNEVVEGIEEYIKTGKKKLNVEWDLPDVYVATAEKSGKQAALIGDNEEKFQERMKGDSRTWKMRDSRKENIWQLVQNPAKDDKQNVVIGDDKAKIQENPKEPQTLKEGESKEENIWQLIQNLNKAQKEAESFIEWTTKFKKRFDIREQWLKNGMKKLGVEWENLEKSLQELQKQQNAAWEVVNATTGITENTILDPRKVKKISIDLSEAKKELRSLNQRLQKGIPVSSRPKCINGREVTHVSGAGMDCLPRATLKAARPGWSESTINKIAAKERQYLVENSKVEYDVESGKVKYGKILNLGGDAGGLLIKHMRGQNLLDPHRGLLVYVYNKDEKNLRCYEMASGDDPYAILLEESQKEQSNHFYALIDPSDQTPRDGA